MLARGGALSPFSGLGSTHENHLSRLKSGLVENYGLAVTHEYPISKNPFGKLWKRWFRAPKNVEKLSKTVDITHITDQEQAGLCPSSGKRVITIHDLFHIFPFESHDVKIGNHETSLIRKKDLQKIRSGINRADLLICVSKFTQKECEMRFPGIKTAYVPHAINLDDYSIETERPKWFEDGKNLIIIGSEENRKRVDFAIKVCAGLDVTLHKIGAESSPHSKKELIDLATKLNCNLNWVGRLDSREMIAALQHSDALLFPSIAEGFGLPPLEAYASGTTALVANAPAHNEIPLEHHILPVDDIESWRNAIINLKDESVMVKNRASEFSIENWCIRMKAAYDSMF